MSTPHKATPDEWKKVRNWAENESYADSVLLEVADRVATLEAVLTSHGEQISGLHSQHNLVVDSITDLQGCVNTLEAAATQPPAPAADHLGRQHAAQVHQEREVVPVLWVRRKPGPGCNASVIAWLPSVEDLPIGEYILYAFPGASQPRQEEDPSQLSDGYHTFAELYEHRHAMFLALMRAMPQHCWFSLRHADGERCFGGDDWFIAGAELPGGSSVTYHLPADLYSLAKATGASRLDLGRPWDGHTASDVVSRLMEWASQPRQEVEPTPPPTPDGGLVDRIMEVVMLDPGRAVRAIHAVADWLKQRSSTIANGSQWAEMLRAETDRSSATPPRPVPPPPAPASGLVEEVARLLANRISAMPPCADCTPLARTVLCVIADAAEKMAHDPNLTWERVAIWLDVESEQEGRADG